MSDEYDRIDRDLMTRRASWTITDRGPRIIIALGGEEIHVTRDVAKNLRDGLTAALTETESAADAGPPGR